MEDFQVYLKMGLQKKKNGDNLSCAKFFFTTLLIKQLNYCYYALQKTVVVQYILIGT